MPLTALTWRQLPTQTVAAGSTSPAAILDAIYTSFISTTYADGAARSPGSGLAWSMSRYQNAGTTEAVYLTPVSSSLNQRIALAGAATSQASATYVVGSTAANAMTYCGVGKNVTGSSATWYGNSGSPFTGGQFSGYAAFFTRNTSYVSTVRTYESLDAIFVTIEQNGITCGGLIAGAFIDPESSDTSSDSESDGKLYGFSVAGPGVNLGFINNNKTAAASNSTALLDTAAMASPTNGYAKTAIFTPGGSALLMLQPCAGTQLSTIAKTKALKNVRFPILLGLYNTSGTAYSATSVASSTFIGRVREVWAVNQAMNGTKFANGGSDVGFVIAQSSTTAYDAIILTK